MSKPMSAAQREHAKKRVENISKAARTKVRTAHTTKAVTLTVGQKKELIRKGTVKLLSDTSLDTYGYLLHCFDFSKHEKVAVLSPVGKTKLDKIDAAEQDAIDNIMLGDAGEALDGLKAFEAAMAKI